MDKLTKKVRHNFFIGYNMIFEQDISIFAKSIYLYLCRCADGQGESFPSHADIAKKCSMSVRKVADAIKELEKIGLLTKETRRNKKGGQTSNLYTISDSPSAQDDPAPLHEVQTNKTKLSENNLSTNKSSQGQGQTNKDIDDDFDSPQTNKAVKEKEPPTVPINRGSTTHQNNKVPPNRTTEETKAQYTKAQQQLELVKDNIEYYDIEDERYRESVDSLLASMEEVFMSNSDTVKIAKTDIPRQAVISTYLKLTRDHIDHALDRLATVRNPIKHIHAYMKTVLFRAYQEYDPYIQNLFNQHYGPTKI